MADIQMMVHFTGLDYVLNECITLLGARESDYAGSDVDYLELNNKEVTEQQEKEKGSESADVIAENEVQDEDLGDQEPNIGKISFVSCATGSSHLKCDTSTNQGNLLLGLMIVT
jgi:hypothetical protein